MLLGSAGHLRCPNARFPTISLADAAVTGRMLCSQFAEPAGAVIVTDETGEPVVYHPSSSSPGRGRPWITQQGMRYDSHDVHPNARPARHGPRASGQVGRRGVVPVRDDDAAASRTCSSCRRPASRRVVTVNYTQLAVLGAEFVGGAVGLLEKRGAQVFDVSAEAEEALDRRRSSTRSSTAATVMSACTPSRINNEGNPEALNPRNGNYGRGLRRLLRLPRAARAVARAGRLRGPGARRRSRRRDRPAASSSSPAGAAGSAPRSPRSSAARARFVVTMDPLVTLDGSEQLPRPRRRRPAASSPPADRPGPRRCRSPTATRSAACSTSWSPSTGGSTRWSTSPASPGRRASPRGPRRTGAACSRCTSTATSTSSRPRCRSWPRPGTAASSASPPARAGEPADAGAYGCAKRAVAALTWQLGRQAPPGVVVNAMSPIAVTRMVTAALERARAGERRRSGARRPPAGCRSARCPSPRTSGRSGAHLVGEDFVVVQRPGDLRRRLRGGGDRPAPAARGGAHRRRGVARRTCSRRSRRRAGPGRGRAGQRRREQPPVRRALRRARAGRPRRRPPCASCAVVTDRAGAGRAVDGRARGARACACHTVAPGDVGVRFAGAADALASAAERLGPLDAVVVGARRPVAGHRRREPGGSGCSPSTTASWTELHADAGWARAVADHAAGADRRSGWSRSPTPPPPAAAAGPRPSAQLARAARKRHRGAGRRVRRQRRGRGRRRRSASSPPTCCAARTPPALSGAELVAGDGWFGLRSHPRPGGSISFGGPALPDWLDDALREIVEAR